MAFQQGFNPKYRPILIAVLGILIAVLVNWLTNLYSPDWLKDYFGEDYKLVILLVTALCVLALLLLMHQQENSQSTTRPSSTLNSYNITNTKAHRQTLQDAKKAIEKAKPDEALRLLSEIRLPQVQESVSLLSARLAKHKISDIQGVLSFEQKDRGYNRLIKDIVDLIAVLESEMKTSAGFDVAIKQYLTERYAQRLQQKMANRQPVNLRRLPTTEGTSAETSAAFVPYNNEEIKVHIAQTFHDAHERLLITGVPGAGKTTLLLELVLALLKSEHDALPVLLNLATWKKEYITLDAWLKEILPAELGVTKSLSDQILTQDRLILLFDGLDEVKTDDRAACLSAIGRYGEVAQRQYALTSRIEEYKHVAKDAPVYLQIEVGALTIAQIETELTRMSYNQPEAPYLLHALQTDTLLREAAQVPFYFNTLQLLFAGGKRLSDLQFKGQTVAERQAEITEQFVAHELSVLTNTNYNAQQAQQWLSFLSLNMNKRDKVVFELVDLQYDWCSLTRWEIFMGNFIFNIAIGLVFALICIIASHQLFLSILVGFCIGYGTTHYRVNEIPLIIIRDNVKWSLPLYLKGAKEYFVSGLTFVLVSIFSGVLVGIFSKKLTVGLVFGLIMGLFVGLIGSLFESIDNYLKENNKGIIQINEPYQRFKASMKVLHFSILQHFHLRYLLSKKGLLPYKLVDFLNDMTQRQFLESDGATWRFRHRLLQDYFAAKTF